MRQRNSCLKILIILCTQFDINNIGYFWFIIVVKMLPNKYASGGGGWSNDFNNHYNEIIYAGHEQLIHSIIP